MTQRELDFTRGEQLAILRHMRFPPGLTAKDGVGVSEKTLMGVLRIIDDHGGGRETWVSQATIAAETGGGIRQVGRAIEVLIARSLLVVQLRKSIGGCVVNHYRIVWSELRLLRGPDRTLPGPFISPDRSAAPTDRSAASGIDRSAASGRRSAPLRPIEAPLPPPTPPAALEEEVYEAGCDQAREAVATATAAGCSDELIRACVAECRRRLLGGGALYRRLNRLRPNDDPTRGWPAADPAVVAARRAKEAVANEEARLADLEAQEAQEAAQRARDRQEVDRLERLAGAEFDGLGRAAQEALVRECFGEPAGQEMAIKMLRRGSPSIRIKLLAHLVSLKEALK